LLYEEKSSSQMTAPELRSVLERFGLAQVEFAELLGVTPRTVSLWATGENQLPGPVSAYLRVLQMLGPDGVAAELRNLARRRQMLDNGLYRIDFTGAVGWGNGVLVLKDGNIAGTDIGGVQYDGRYAFDTANSVNVLDLIIDVPPNGELVTGLVAGPNGEKVSVRAVCVRPSPEAVFVASGRGQQVQGNLQKLRAL
jgi:hypothetical protein